LLQHIRRVSPQQQHQQNHKDRSQAKIATDGHVSAAHSPAVFHVCALPSISPTRVLLGRLDQTSVSLIPYLVNSSPDLCHNRVLEATS
jgi:hypothetical protein